MLALDMPTRVAACAGLTKQVGARLLTVTQASSHHPKPLATGPTVRGMLRAVRRQLEALRRQGVSFDEAWRAAVEESSALGSESLTVLRATRASWEAAYGRLPLPPGSHRVRCPTDEDDGPRWPPLLHVHTERGRPAP